MANVTNHSFMMIFIIILNVLIIAFSIVNDSKAGECACYPMNAYELACIDTETKEHCEL